MKNQSRTIVDYLSEIQDCRLDNANKRHELIDILVIALCGMLSGADDWVSIAQYGREKEEWFGRLCLLG